MHFRSLYSLLFVPLVSAQLNKLAKEAGLLYFGTATDNDELSNKTYFKILTDTQEFGQFTPANGMKVHGLCLLCLSTIRFPIYRT